MARAKIKFYVGQKVKFIAGSFKGKTGIVQYAGDRVLTKINGSGPDANGRKTKLGSTFAEYNEIQPVQK